MQSLIRSKSAGVTGGRGTAGAGPGRDLLYGVIYDVDRPLPERTYNGICLLLPRGPCSALALGQDPAPKRHGNMSPVVPDLLEDCPHGIVRGVCP